MLIRKFKPIDIFSVMRIISETFLENYEPALLMDFHSSWNDGFIVAEENNDVVGFILGISPAPNQARILILAVDEKYREKGIGATLLNAFIQACLIRNVKLITLEVRTTNEAAIRFYGKYGFCIVHMIPDYYKDGENGYIMHKTI
ncbi:MAG: ribosomal protein S18-alanine N-acetyltransferase [Thermoplasmatales archaeon]|nr:ribosomal protein S18-alanine N-acetyltransferase [Thermoplasmatales archaeon]